MLRDILRVMRKELGAFFASPAAFLFLGAFLLVTLFVFFWVETFFARNIADVRPLFKWLPVLLIFLVAALTMRTWSEERRSGTLESLLTSPVSTFSLVFGKFAAGLALVALALLLTLPLPITVAFLGPLDWGPVIGGYVATLFLAAAYLAIGQTMSARTDNPVVALILTAVVCGAFYLIGSDTLAALFGSTAGGVLAQIGTGTRFESITRGVLDLRDLYYYLSLVGLFLTLNLFSLERIRWAGNPASRAHRQAGVLAALCAANFVVANLWLAPIGWARADITSGNMYSLSSATRDTLAEAKEPLLIRGYFSAQTHPLLAPLLPQLRDLLEEYALAGGGQVKLEIINPQGDKAKEDEAAAKYGVQPVPFQVASKYQAGMVSSYFDVVVAYGDQFERLGFRDLIEVKGGASGAPDVVLRDPEYALTRAVRKVIGSYRAGGSPFDGITGDVVFKGYFSPNDRLPPALQEVRRELDKVLADIAKESGGRFKSEFIDPDANGGEVGRNLQQRFGYRPQVANLVDPKPFWFYMMLEAKGSVQAVAMPSEAGDAALMRSLRSSLQRMGSGGLRTVALVGPTADMEQQGGYAHLRRALGENARVIDADLTDGVAPPAADLLMVLAPHEMSEKQVFAIDQFLMQGGSVVLATAPFEVDVTDAISVMNKKSGLEDWLAHQGITMEKKLVMDAQNAALPVPSSRNVGSVVVREMRMLPYPPFPDVRGPGLNPNTPITANLGQLTFNWAAPINVAREKIGSRKAELLAQTSPRSWLSDIVAAVPSGKYANTGGFPPPENPQISPLAVAFEGKFDSFFKGKHSPLAASAPAAGNAPVAASVIEHSKDSARLVLVSSNNFASDLAIGITSSGLGTFYGAPLVFMQNAVDWSLEDRALLALRGRTQFARTLDPEQRERQPYWEGLNYGLAIAGLFLVWLVRRGLRVVRNRQYSEIIKEVGA